MIIIQERFNRHIYVHSKTWNGMILVKYMPNVTVPKATWNISDVIIESKRIEK